MSPTPRPQIEIFEALGAPVPAFAHFPLLVGAGGEALSKRLGSLSLAALREDGIEPLAVASYLAKIGTSDPVEPRLSLDELAAEFDFAKIGRAPAHFDAGRTDGAERQDPALPCPMQRGGGAHAGVSEALWDAIKPNLDPPVRRRRAGPAGDRPGDAGDRRCRRWPPRPPRCCRPNPGTKPPGAPGPRRWRPTPAPRAGRCFIPLRLALTGREHGPELKKLLPLIGRAKALARLKGETA